MYGDGRSTASTHYAFGQLERAFQQASAGRTGAERRRGRAKVARWNAVLAGMADGHLHVGSRTPVADTPAWVTLEVAHGGFATGRYLAETPLSDDEVQLLASLPAAVPASTDRERLNLWYLSDAGQAELLSTLASGAYYVEVPEEAALLVVAWLLDRGHGEAALDLVAELRPLMHRLRMTPRRAAGAEASGETVHLEPVRTVRDTLRAATVPAQVAVMVETLWVWNPLYDRLVSLWTDTVDGELPCLAGASAVRDEVTGGWPARVWPHDWAERRRAWLADYEAALETHTLSRSHLHSKSNFARLRRALQACETDSRALSGRDVGWIRRALANTISKHGAPGSESRAALRAAQLVVARRPTHAALADALAARLDRYPGEGGIPSVEAVVDDVDGRELPGAGAGQAVPSKLVATVSRALEAPVSELLARGLITSGEVLAKVLPQITSQVLAADLGDAALRTVYARTYAAFRRRRSLLLLDLKKQVGFGELPWIAALAPLRTTDSDVAGGARQTLRHTTVLALHAFPQAITPNPLVREMAALAERAGLRIPLVEEVAADIFMGTFTAKWREAAAVASDLLAGSLYARYYDLPAAGAWAEQPQEPRSRLRARRAGGETADNFARVCAVRAGEAGADGAGRSVAGNGAVLEQSQILTTHNLAVLVDVLQLGDQLGELAPQLADRALTWVVRRLATPVPDPRAQRQVIKNSAYAWRQAIFFLSFCDTDVQREAVTRLRGQLDANPDLSVRFAPAVDGLEHVVSGGRFEGAGLSGGGARRFLGWSVGRHWCSPPKTSERPAFRTA